MHVTVFGQVRSPTDFTSHLTEEAFVLLVVAEGLGQEPHPTIQIARDETVLAVLLDVLVDMLGRHHAHAAREWAWHDSLHALHHFMHLHVAGPQFGATTILTADDAEGATVLEVLLEIFLRKLSHSTVLWARYQAQSAIVPLVLQSILSLELRPTSQLTFHHSPRAVQVLVVGLVHGEEVTDSTAMLTLDESEAAVLSFVPCEILAGHWAAVLAGNHVVRPHCALERGVVLEILGDDSSEVTAKGALDRAHRAERRDMSLVVFGRDSLGTQFAHKRS